MIKQRVISIDFFPTNMKFIHEECMCDFRELARINFSNHRAHVHIHSLIRCLPLVFLPLYILQSLYSKH